MVLSNEATDDFSEMPSFRCKSSWKTPQGNASLELFLSRIERENYMRYLKNV